MSAIVPSPKEIAGFSRKEAERRAHKLREQIRHHDYLYYVQGKPEISDAQYDQLFRALQHLEERFPELVSPDSPTQRVGARPQEALRTVRHTAPMRSLEATREAEEVRRFDRRIREAMGESPRYLVEEKFDGLSVELVYRGGRLEQGATRGDGTEGEDITENVKTIGSVPLRLRTAEREAPALLAVRGEILMQIPAFERLNRRLLEQGHEPFANPRNAAAGSLRQLDPRVTAERPLELVTYEILAIEGQRFATDRAALEALRAWGLPVPGRIVESRGIQKALDCHHRWVEGRETLDHEIDGIVIKLDDLEGRERLGATSHHPRWALAYKFEPRREITRIRDIVTQVGRTGLLTPVALLQPVEVGGVTVSRATLHNREEVRRKGVRPGDLVRVRRAGDVIPEVGERIAERGRKRRPPFRMPSRCPACNSRLISEGPLTRCPNRFGCPAQLTGRLQHFGSKAGMDIEGLGGETAAALVDRGLVEGLADLYGLRAEDIRRLDGFAQRSARKLAEAIRRNKRVPLDRFLFALGIPEVGEAVARDLAGHFRSLAAVRRADRAALEAIPGVGPKMAAAIRQFLSDRRTRETIDALLAAGVRPRTPQAAGPEPLQGRTFVFTGGLDRFTRSEAKRLVESLGGRATSSVSGETDYVVAGAEPGQKLAAAREKPVKVLDEEEFVSLLREAGAAL